MKCTLKQFCLPLIAVLIVGFSSCITSQHIDIENDEIEASYNKSVDLWNKMKAENGGNYEFSTTTASVFGSFTKTVYTVKNNKVVGRKHYATNAGSQSLELVFEENESNINTTPDRGTAITMDQVYKTCATESLKQPEYYGEVDGEKMEANKLIFRTDENGILESCGYRDVMCSDDCYKGYTIADLKWLN